jgi:hypothetical protein
MGNPSLSVRRIVVAAIIAAALVLTVVSFARPAGPDKRLDRIKGDVGFATAADAPVHQVFGREILPDDDFAITRAKSAAQVVLPDSSIVALGENTQIKVGAFDNATTGPGSTIALNGGSLRFDIHRPAGGAANYRFTTATSQIAVRGTIGLLSLLGGNTTVACLVCAADSVTVTVGTQTIALAAGQVVTITATGAVVTGAISSATLSTFSAASVSTSTASGSAAASAGVAGTSGGIAGAGAGAVAGAAAGAAAVGVGISSLTHSTPSPGPTASAAPTTAPTASPSPGPSPSATPNAPIQIQRAASATPAAAAVPTAVRPASTSTAPEARGVPGGFPMVPRGGR